MLFGSAFAIYFIIWWLTLFAVLPFGVRSQQESGEVIAGSDPGAPAVPRMVRVLVLTTIVSALLFGVFWFVYVMNAFDLTAIREMKR
jgi:predicted secreted protein